MHRLGIFSLLALSVARGLAMLPPDLNSEIVALPEFQVFTSRMLPPPEKWNYATVGNFEILSSTSPSHTAQFARDFQRFQDILAIVCPQAKIDAELPLSVILCDDSTQFDSFSARPFAHTSPATSSLLLRDQEIAAIVLDYGAQHDFPESASEAGGLYSPREFYRQYIIMSMSQQNPRPPVWLLEGVADIFSSIDYTDTWVDFAKVGNFYPSQVSPTAMDSSFSRLEMGGSLEHQYLDGRRHYPFFGELPLHGRTGLTSLLADSPLPTVAPYIMPWPEFFSVRYDSPEFTGTAESTDAARQLWRSQAATFVHMCLYGRKARFQKGFIQLIQRSTHEPITEALVKECLGMSFTDLGMELRGYIDRAYHYHYIFKSKQGQKLPPLPEFSVRPATDGEVGRIKGEAYRLAGRSDAAQTEFVTSYLRGQRDPQLLASLGLMARKNHDDRRARIYLESATEAKIPRPRAYLELARLRYEDIRHQHPDTPLTIAQAATVLTPLFEARETPPVLPDVYHAIAEAWENTSAVPTRANLTVLDEGVRLFPWDAALLYEEAALFARHGFKPDAAERVSRGLQITRDAALRAKFEQLQQELGPVGRNESSLDHFSAVTSNADTHKAYVDKR